MSGKDITAQEAYEMGFVTRWCLPISSWQTVHELAAKILSDGPIGVRLAKACVNSSLSVDI